MRVAQVLRGLAKLAAVVVIAGAVGAGLGGGLAALGADEPGVQLAPVPLTTSAEPAGTPATTTALATEPPTGTTTAPTLTPVAAAARATVRVRVLSAVLHPASGGVGARRGGGRLSVHVRVINGGSSVREPARPALLAPAPAAAVVGDVVGGGPGASLREPLRPGARVQGRLRFETSEAVTAGIVTTRRIRIRIAGVTVSVARVKIGTPIKAQAGERAGRATPPRAPSTGSASPTPRGNPARQPATAPEPAIRSTAPASARPPVAPRNPQSSPPQTQDRAPDFESVG